MGVYTTPPFVSRIFSFLDWAYDFNGSLHESHRIDTLFEALAGSGFAGFFDPLPDFTGPQEYRNAGKVEANRFGELDAGHLRHLDVAHDQLHGIGMVCHELECHATIARRVAWLLDHRRNEDDQHATDCCVIVHDEDALLFHMTPLFGFTHRRKFRAATVISASTASSSPSLFSSTRSKS